MVRSLKACAFVGAVPAAALTVGNPGAGMVKEDIKPFKEWHKDGYSAVDCVLDDMLLHGDKHGDNKAAYALKDTAGVSIIRYTDVVSKMDRKDMTHEVCYEFCRTVEHMLFFGIQNGRDCYCAPYFKAAAGDSSACDAPCDGDPGTMCGGKSKSAIFSMHFCDQTKSDHEAAMKAGGKAKDALAEVTTKVSDASKKLQKVGADLQKSFGKVGDGAASGQMQDAKGFAGELEAAAKDGEEKGENIGKIKPAGDDLPAIEAATADLKAATSAADAETAKLAKLEKLAVGAEAKGTAKLYYPVMYFVDKKLEDVPTTCGGDAAAKPMLGNMDSCASTCEELGSLKCVGFQFYPEEGGMCVLLSKVKTATYYTGCGKSAFLQSAPADTKCVLKFTEFEGQSIKPDGSGKCKFCLKEAKKADRCFQ